MRPGPDPLRRAERISLRPESGNGRLPLRAANPVLPTARLLGGAPYTAVWSSSRDHEGAFESLVHSPAAQSAVSCETGLLRLKRSRRAMC